jgi:hypothetical protein
MSEVTRYDFSRLDNIERTPSGGLRIPGNLTRIGVLEYKFPDGSVRRELRHPDHVFKADSLKTLRDAPVTDLHPPEMVKPENYSRYSRGHISDYGHTDTHVTGTLAVQDADLIKKIDAKERQEISMGYRCDLDHTPGVFNGEKYDAIQTNIRYNHVAIGPEKWGRAGSSVALRLDSCDAFSEPHIGQESRKPDIMKTIRLDGADYECGSDAHLAKLDSMHKEVVQSMQTQLDKEKGRADGLAAELATVKTKLATAEDPARIDTAVQARVKLETSARKVLGPDAKLDGLSERAIMLNVLKLDEKAVEGKSDDYLRGRFDTATAGEGGTQRRDSRSISHALDVAGGGHPPDGVRRQDGQQQDGDGSNVTRIDAVESQKKNRKELHNAGRAPLPGTVQK